MTSFRPDWTRAAGIAAQAFALFWTLAGILTIVIGTGPRTVGDVTYHMLIVAVLVRGLVVTARLRPVVP